MAPAAASVAHPWRTPDFDLTDVWGVDTSIAVDMLRVFVPPAECRQYPDAMGYGKHFDQIVPARATGNAR